MALRKQSINESHSGSLAARVKLRAKITLLLTMICGSLAEVSLTNKFYDTHSMTLQARPQTNKMPAFVQRSMLAR